MGLSGSSWTASLSEESPGESCPSAKLLSPCSYIERARSRRTCSSRDAALSTCDQCGGPVHRLLAATPFILKGGGWHVTDYPSEARKKALSSESGEKSSAASEAKSSTASDSSSSAPSSPPSSSPSGESSGTSSGSKDSAKSSKDSAKSGS